MHDSVTHSLSVTSTATHRVGVLSYNFLGLQLGLLTSLPSQVNSSIWTKGLAMVSGLRPTVTSHLKSYLIVLLFD